MANYTVDIQLALKAQAAEKKLKDIQNLVNRIDGRVASISDRFSKLLVPDKTFARIASKLKNIEGLQKRSLAVVQQRTNRLRQESGLLAGLKKNEELRNQILRQTQVKTAQRLGDLRAQTREISTQAKLRKMMEEGAGIRASYKADAQRNALSSPIGGRANIPGSPAARRGRRQSAALGVGFPLLFGGGAGSIAGGLLGSGGGFGGQIIGSAIGQQIDQFANKLVGLAGALDGTGGSTEALEELLGDLDSETARRIQNLEKSGQSALAADTAFQKLSDEIGDDLAKAAVLAGQDLNNLGNQVTKFFTILGVSIASLFQEALYLNTRDPLEGVPEVSPETAAERATSGEAIEVARVQLELAEAKLAKNQESAFAAEQELIDLRKANDLAEITRQIQDDSLDAKIGENKQREIELRARREATDLAERTAAADERSVREAERAAAKAEREARQRERDLQRRENKENQTLKTINSLIISNNEIALQSAQIAHGEEVALEQQAASLFEKFRILKKNVELSTEDARVKDLQLQKLDLQKQLESNQISSRQRSLQVEKAITAEKRKQALAAIGTNVGRQIQDANFRSTGDSAQDAQIALRIDQIRRQEDVTTRLTNAIKEQQITINNPPNADAAMRAEEQRQNLQDQLDLYNQLLPQLDAAEQSQLRFNQALEAVQPITDTVVSGLFTAISAVAEGTKTAEQAFADFLRSIGDMLIQAAAQMIAQYIAIGIAKAFAFGGSRGPDFSQFGTNTTGVNTSFGIAPAPFRLAEGGYVTGPTNAVVGEGGEPEYIIPQSKMRESMNRYSRGARGSSVIPAVGGGGASSEGGGAAVAVPIDVRYTVERINDVDYVTAEQFQQGMQKAAAEGAQRGQQLTLSRLQQSPATRRRIGM